MALASSMPPTSTISPAPTMSRALPARAPAGPSLSVTLNGQPDYFGTTVNLAARVQRLSHGGDVAFSQEVHDDPEVRALLARGDAEQEQAALKGIAEPVRFYRWQVVAPR